MYSVRPLTVPPLPTAENQPYFSSSPGTISPSFSYAVGVLWNSIAAPPLSGHRCHWLKPWHMDWLPGLTLDLPHHHGRPGLCAAPAFPAPWWHGGTGRGSWGIALPTCMETPPPLSAPGHRLPQGAETEILISMEYFGSSTVADL